MAKNSEKLGLIKHIEFVVDECVPEAVCRAIQRIGRHALHLNNTSHRGKPDIDIINFIKANNDKAILVTADQKMHALASYHGVRALFLNVDEALSVRALKMIRGFEFFPKEDVDEVKE